MRRGVALGALASAIVWASSIAAVSAQAPPPSLRLVAASPKVTIEADELAAAGAPGVYVAAVGGAFELRASRPDYGQPLRIVQVDAGTGAVVRTLPSRIAAGWRGLRRFARVTVRTGRGRVVSSRYVAFCPNGGRQRVNHGGPLLPRYPDRCLSFPFTRGMVWGIDDGWSASLSSAGSDGLGDEGLAEVVLAASRVRSSGRRSRPRGGRYAVTVEIAPLYRKLFAVPSGADRVTVRVTVKRERQRRRRLARGPAAAASARARAAEVPTVAAAAPATLPDLVALPGYDISLVNRRGRNVLRFASSVWNAGPGQLVIEGFRRPGQPTMDAHQYFVDRSGTAVARASAGTMRFHAARRHDHWHLLQFSGYSLLDASRRRVLRGRKQSFCLANTDVVDLTVPHAKWAERPAQLETACGDPASIWIRETLAVGWADTYGAHLPGQAFDVTKLRNGRYHLHTEANPLATLREAATANNVAIRTIRLRGKGKRRRVAVAPWKGIRR